MGESSYTSAARRADRTNDNKYKTLVEKLILLEANDWPVSGPPEKKTNKQKTALLHLVEFYQVSAQQQVGNGERSNVVVLTKTHVGSITPRTTKSVKISMKTAVT